MTDPSRKREEKVDLPCPSPAEPRRDEDELAFELAEEWTSPEPALP
jgi:hypothetical protein